MLVYFFAALIILVTCQIFEKRYKVKKTCTKFKECILKNDQSLITISNEIIQNQIIQSLENIFGEEVDFYLTEKEEAALKVIALNNEKAKNISELQYVGILKKLERQDVFYSFNIDTGSIYYRFRAPYENFILWLYIR